MFSNRFSIVRSSIIVVCALALFQVVVPRLQSVVAEQWARYHSDAWAISFDYLPTWNVVEQSVPMTPLLKGYVAFQSGAIFPKMTTFAG